MLNLLVLTLAFADMWMCVDVMLNNRYTKAAEHGSSLAMNTLATLYDDGLGVKKDPSEAMRLYRLAADDNIPQAQFNLGIRYLIGSGVCPKDASLGLRWLRLAASNGHSKAACNLSTLLWYGEGPNGEKGFVPVDMVEATKWRKVYEDLESRMSFVNTMVSGSTPQQVKDNFARNAAASVSKLK